MHRYPGPVLCLALVGPTLAAAQDPELLLRIDSDPPGALVTVDSVALGTTPLERSLRVDGGGELSVVLTLEGYEPATLELPGGSAEATLSVPLVETPGLIQVTTPYDLPSAYDGHVTLREALEYASGARRPLGADRTFLRGSVGREHADRIEFLEAAFGAQPFAFVTAELPALDGAGDVLAGPEAGITLMPASGHAVPTVGLRLGAGVEVQRLTVDGFRIGLLAEGFGEVRCDEVAVHAAEIGVEARDGAMIRTSAVRVEARFAERIATEGALIGDLEPAPTLAPGAATVHVQQAWPPRLRLVGRMQHGVWEPRVYLHEDEPLPLHAVPGIEATSSSMEMYTILTYSQPEQPPWFAVDGNGDYFRWAFRGSPEREYLQVTLARPVRTDRVTVRHRSIDGNRLLRYRFRLLDHAQHSLFEREVRAGSVDTLDFGQSLDFTAIRLEVLEAEGNPAIDEIEAVVIDTRELSPLAYSSHQAVFPLPDHDGPGLARIGDRLCDLGDRALLPGNVIAVPEPFTVAFDPPPRVIHVTSAADGDREDDVLTLREALSHLAGTRRLTPGEAAHLSGPENGFIRIELPEGRMLLDSPLPAIEGLTKIELVGRARLEGPEPLLSLRGCRAVSLRDLAVTGGVYLEAVAHAELRDLELSAESLACRLDAEVALVSGCRFADAEVGLETSGECHVVGCRFEGLGTGWVARFQQGRPLVALGNEGEVTAPLLRLERVDAWDRPVLLLGANRGSAPVADPDGSYALLTFANDPPRLGLTAEQAESVSSIGGRQVVDLRRGRGPRLALRTLEARSTTRTLIQGAGDVHHRGAFLTLLTDGPVEVWWKDAAANHHEHVAPPGFPGAGPSIGLTRVDWLEDPSLELEGFWSGGLPTTRTRDLAQDLETMAVPSPSTLSSLRRQIAETLQHAPGAALESAVAAYQRWPVASLADAVQDAAIHAATAKADLAEGITLLVQAAQLIGSRETLDHTRASLHVNFGNELAGAARYEEAVAHLDQAIALGDAEAVAVAQGNQTVFFGRWARERLGNEPASETVRWIRATVAARPELERLPANLRATLNQAAGEHLDARRWPAAEAVLLAVRELDLGDETAANNLVYLYQEWAQDRLATESPAAVVAWLDEAIAAHGDLAAHLRGHVDQVLTRGAEAARNAGRYADAFALIVSLHQRAGADQKAERRQWVLGEYQTWCSARLGRDDLEGALDALRAVRDALAAPEPAFLVTPFDQAVQARLEAGRVQEALDLASALYRDLPGETARSPLTRATQAQADAALEREGALAASDVWIAVAGKFPGDQGVHQACAGFMGNLAIPLFNEQRYADAVTILKRCLTLDEDNELVRGNLRTAYYNHVVTEVNAGRRAAAKAILEEALERFPEDEKLKSLRAIVD